MSAEQEELCAQGASSRGATLLNSNAPFSFGNLHPQAGRCGNDTMTSRLFPFRFNLLSRLVAFFDLWRLHLLATISCVHNNARGRYSCYGSSDEKAMCCSVRLKFSQEVRMLF